MEGTYFTFKENELTILAKIFLKHLEECLDYNETSMNGGNNSYSILILQ